MKFSHEIIGQVIKEIEKVPNIRYVCNKVGIDHSTFYRWMMYHPTFKKKVTMALFLGRRAISGAAETVIIKGVQKGDHKSAIFWLAHNDPQYMQRDKGKHYGILMERDAETMKNPIKYDGSNFETLFKFLKELEQKHDEETCEKLGSLMVEFFCDGDKNLMDLFYPSFEQWKIEQIRREAKEEILKEQ